MNVIDENAVAAFQENLAAKRAEFDEWAQSQIANARVMVDDHNDTMAKLQGRFSFLPLCFFFSNLFSQKFKQIADTKTLQEHEKKYRVKAESLHTGNRSPLSLYPSPFSLQFSTSSRLREKRN